ncbi:MAG: demethoxyubiquinone hydroxylase family protein [Alphaproteobacteria bacterium]|nr:demethoxyubiquinone hydroxylase family protein [Alphaproteobacteria bacterium]
MPRKKLKQKKISRTLPGDAGTTPCDHDVDSMIRVNHAGEYGAKRIYEGQLAVLGDDPEMRELIEHMAEQERAHLEYFEKEIVRRGVRPTALHPLWHAAGYALGAVTARMGKEAAMACTVAVESVISEHYQQQLDVLKNLPEEKALRQKIRKFKEEEEEHHDIGLEHDAEQAPAYRLLSKVIMGGSRLAIKVAKRI